MGAVVGVPIHWTGILDWTTGLSYFLFLDKFLCLCLESNLHFRINKYLATMDDHNDDDSCLLQCF